MIGPDKSVNIFDVFLVLYFDQNIHCFSFPLETDWKVTQRWNKIFESKEPLVNWFRQKRL
jgi:hypothetical protein